MLPAFCGYGCGTLLMPDDDWVAAHVVDGQPEYGYIAACPTCNERAKNGRLEPVPEATRFGKSLAGEGGRNTRAPNQRLSQLRTKRAPATSEVPFA